MPAYEALASFLRDYDALRADQQRAFRQALKKFIDDVDHGHFRPGLRVKGIRGMPGHYEMTWAPDGRAIFRYGAPVRLEIRHVVWVAIGTHDVLLDVTRRPISAVTGAGLDPERKKQTRPKMISLTPLSGLPSEPSTDYAIESRQVIAMINRRDNAAAAFYEDPANREFAGPARRRRARQGRLTEHVPIRFAAETIEKVQLLADEDGQTVSGWIRDLVEREVRLRLPRSLGTQLESAGSFEVRHVSQPEHIPVPPPQPMSGPLIAFASEKQRSPEPIRRLGFDRSSRPWDHS